MKIAERAKQIAGSYSPFINPPDMAHKLEDSIRDAIEMAIQYDRVIQKIISDWKQNGKFTYDGLTYIKGINDISAEKILNSFA